jgi:hypothetical protein
MKPLFFILLFPLHVLATNYYISGSGNDANAGTSAGTAWRTTSKLNSFFSSLHPGDSVLFKRGDIFYGGIIANKSGRPGLPITIGAYGTGANPVITGFTTISSWTNLGGNIWESTNAVSTLSYTNMVTVNGINTGMGRTPNYPNLYRWQKHAQGTPGSKSTITSRDLNKSVIDWTGAEAAIFTTTYRISRDIIDSMPGSTVLAYREPGSPDLYQNSPGYFLQQFQIQNDLRTLDTLNEWYYNPSTKKLDIYETNRPGTVQIATIDTLVSVHGKSYITFTGIDFTGAGKCCIEVTSSPNIIISACNFSFSGRDGVHSPLNINSKALDIDNCTFTQMNNNAIDIGRTPSAFIYKNTITVCGMIPGMFDHGDGTNGNETGEGIVANGANGIIRRNNIDSTSYNGIYHGGNNTIVDSDFVNHACYGVAIKDGGAIYSWNGTGRTGSNNKVLHCIVTNTGQSSKGIYTDDGDTLIEIAYNTVYNAFENFYNHNTSDLNFHDNTSYAGIETSWMFVRDDTNRVINKIISKHNILFARANRDFVMELYRINASSTPNIILDSNYYAKPCSACPGFDPSRVIFVVNAPLGSTMPQTKRTLSGSGSWQAFSAAVWKRGMDIHSHMEPKTISDTNDLRFEFNATMSNKTVSIPFNYIDVRGATYNGSITLAPYTSAVLIKNGAIH